MGGREWGVLTAQKNCWSLCGMLYRHLQPQADTAGRQCNKANALISFQREKQRYELWCKGPWIHHVMSFMSCMSLMSSMMSVTSWCIVCNKSQVCHGCHVCVSLMSWVSSVSWAPSTSVRQMCYVCHVRLCLCLLLAWFFFFFIGVLPLKVTCVFLIVAALRINWAGVIWDKVILFRFFDAVSTSAERNFLNDRTPISARFGHGECGPVGSLFTLCFWQNACKSCGWWKATSAQIAFGVIWNVSIQSFMEFRNEF